MLMRTSGGRAASIARHGFTQHMNTLKRDRRGVILLAVLVFVALLLPLVTLVLTSINTESVSTAEAIKGAKAELAAEKAINDAVSLVVQEKEYPSYYTSVAQSANAEIIGEPQFLVAGGVFDRAIIVRDAITGERRDQLEDSTGTLTGSGQDDMWGTGDDYWVGPRRDRSYIPGDYDASSAMYRYDFRFNKMHGPTYIGQTWSFSTDNRDFAFSQFTDDPVWLFNQFAAIDPRESTVVSGVPSGYDVTDPFGGTDNAEVNGPGYYTGAPEPAGRDLSDGGIENYLYSAKVNLYESIYSDLDRGPIPTSLLKSYANVTDEAGRINLNIFCKKVRVYMPESVETDYDFDGYSTNDFNMNTVTDEDGWKWMDNPMFPDRYTTRTYDYDFSSSSSSAALLNEINDETITGDPIDFGIYDPDPNTTTPFVENTGAPDEPLAELGETVQHLYTGDTDGDGVPESVESMRTSLRMLTSIPGVDPRTAAAILTYLNPPHDIPGSGGGVDGDPDRDYNPVLDWWYPTLHEDYNVLATDPTVEPEYGRVRLDACNITPPLICQDIEFTGGVMDERRWALGRSEDDDLPLPTPHPFTNLEDLRNIPGVSATKFKRLKDYVTIFSYDTNLLANYIQDVGMNVELDDAYTPGDREYTGSVIRAFAIDDSDDLADMRFSVDEYVYSTNQRDVQAQAERMFAFAKAHLPRPLFDKIHLPVVDRLGRADEIDSYRQNDDPVYNLSQGGLYIPHRDSDEHPYNVGASGHQYNIGGGSLEGAGYPALNPEFTLDSCLAIVTYRNGASTQLGDDYSSNPQAGNYSTIARLPFGPLLGFIRQVNGPIAYFLDQLQDLIIVNPNAGFNVNPIGRSHGTGIMTMASLLNPGEFDSVADTLNVPLYGFRNLAIDVMCDPPSSYRADVRQPAANTIQAFDPIEQSPVNYYASMSDVWDIGDYLAFAGDDGQLGTADDSVESIGADSIPGTADDPELYRVYFTIASQPDTANPTAINPDMWQAEIPITSSQLRAINAGTDEGKTKITVVAYDNINNINVLGPEMLNDSAWINTYGPASGYAGYGDLFYNFSWQDCPYPEDYPAGVGVGDDANGRPDENMYWEGGIRPAFDDAYAFDLFGDPFLMARAEVVKQWGDSDPAVASEENQLRADDTARLYIQNNLDAVVPFRVDILPVRVAGDSYELRSAVGGETTTNGTYLLYDWELNGDRTAADQLSFDGTWPEHQIGQNFDPRIIRVAPGADTVSLRVYDLRAFEDGTLNLPVQSGFPELSGMTPAPYTSGEVNLDPLNTGGNGWPGLPVPVNGDAGYWEDTAAVQRIITIPEILPEITATTPSIYSNETELRFLASAVGGGLPYTMTLRVSNDLNALVTTSNFDGSEVWAAGTGGTAADWVAYNTFSPGLPAPTLGYAGQVASQLGASLAATAVITSNDVEEIFNVDLGAALPAGTYWVELEVADGAQIEWAYTTVTVGTESSPSGSTGRAPEMAASINLRPLDSAGGDTRLGFVANATADGGSGGYSYYWEVTRPIYDDDGVITSYSIVDSVEPFVSIDAVEFDSGSGSMRINPAYTGQPMISNESNPSFEFHLGDFYTQGGTSPGAGDGTTDAYGIYFIHCYVFDRAGTNPSLTDVLVAHDVAMVRINDTGNADIGDALFSTNLARTPMAVLHALPPGNASAPVDPTEINSSGPGSIVLDHIDPSHAAVGDVIAIYGNGFDVGAATANTVRFGGGATALGTRVEDLGGGDGILYVKVPTGARTGYLAVTSSGTTSDGMFFMTNFPVTFDLIGNLAVGSANYLQFDLDYQGDGHIDYTYSTMADPQHPGYIDGTEQDLTYDYARDGVGNYMATLYVTDLISGRVQKDQQLVMIRDPEEFDDITITLASGEVDETRSDGILIDDDRDFDPNWASYAVEVVQNPGPGEVIGAVTGYDSGTGGLITSLANWVVGDLYTLRRTIEVEGTGDMIVNIWPEIDQRYDTFTPDYEEYSGDADAGLSFYSAAGGGFYSSSDYTYKWLIDDNTMRSTSVTYAGEITDPDPVELDPTSGRYTGYNGRHAVVIDDNATFISSGVKAGDVFYNGTDGDSFATILQVVSETELLLASPGLGGGAAPRRQRSGTIDQVLAGQVTASGSSWISDWDWTIEDTDYNFFGLHTGGTQGGLVGDPAGTGAATANGDGSDYYRPDTAVNNQLLKEWTNTTEHTRWEIVSTPQAGATDQLVVSRLPNPQHADDRNLPVEVTLAGVRGPQDGVRQFNLNNGGAVALGGAPPRYNIRTNQVWSDYTGVYDPVLGVGAYVFCVDSGSLWRIVDVPVSAGGTLSLTPGTNRWLQVEYVSGGAPTWYDGPIAAQRQNWIVLPSQWLPGDNWGAVIAKRQLRVGDLYRIVRDRDGVGEGAVNVQAWADADYASLDAPIDFDIKLTYPFDLVAGIPSTIEVNWNSTDYAGVEPPRPVDSTTIGDGGTTGFEEETLHISHQFSVAGLTNAWFWLNYTDSTGAHQIGPYQLPQVTVGGDDFDTWPAWNGSELRVNSWDSSTHHRVSCEVSYDVAAGGSPYGANRRFAATDQLFIPAGMQSSADALTSFVSYSRPFVTSNAVSASRMRHQGVHGASGASLNWVADANADSLWSNLSESPLDTNPVNYYEFIFGTPRNQMNISGLAYPGNGACFPRAVPGVGHAGTTGGFTYYIADRGVYTGMGFITEALPSIDDRGFSFDSQPIFVGERLSGNDSTLSRINLAADIYINPLAATNSQQLALRSYVTGGNGNPDNYNYLWTVERYSANPYTWTSTRQNPLFYPLEADASGDGSGSYRAYLTVTAPTGSVRTGFVEFEVVTPSPLVNVMANPPSTTTGSNVEFQVFQEGYNYDAPGGVEVRIDFGKTTPAFTGSAGWDWTSTTVTESGLVTFETTYLEQGDYDIVVDMPGGAAVDAATEVAVADRIPLKASLLASPPSGVAPFVSWIDYSVSGGEPFSDDTYQVVLQLINTTTGDTSQVALQEPNTFGPNGVKDSLDYAAYDDDPVYFVIPEAGSYVMFMFVLDNSGNMYMTNTSIFAGGYTAPVEYGRTGPIVVTDKEGRPMHAMRIWSDPFLSRGGGTATEFYGNTPNDLRGGRLLEADLQVLGDVFQTDPNPNWRSFGNYGSVDPYAQPRYYADYSLSAQDPEDVEDYYDTFTEGRININTASVETLTALFRNIRRLRGYDFYGVDSEVPTVDLDGDGVNDVLYMRDPTEDVYLTQSEARALAEAVVNYRNAYYDLYKPDINGGSNMFGYRKADGDAAYGLGDFRVDHLPVLGPYDGVNPYDKTLSGDRLTDRSRVLADADDNELNNTYDHLTASYYNFTNNQYMFYSPTDIAFVRPQGRFAFDIDNDGIPDPIIDTNGDLIPDQVYFTEPASNYAKYLNDVVSNRLWDANRYDGAGFDLWPDTGLTPGADNYTRWSFDARNYFYHGGAPTVLMTLDTGTGAVAVDAVHSDVPVVSEGRNELAIIQSNDESAYAYIDNPPFRSLFDLYKVINSLQEPDTFGLGNGTSDRYLDIYTGTGNTVEGTTVLNHEEIWRNNQVFSGPSMFRYACHWHEEAGEFIPVANYLDDIAPFVTCRSYVFRVEAVGAVTASGGSAGAVLDTARISRDRTKEAIVDVGPLWTQTGAVELSDTEAYSGLRSRDRQNAYNILYYRDNTQ